MLGETSPDSVVTIFIGKETIVRQSRIVIAPFPVLLSMSRVLIVGSNCNNGSKCGRYWNLNNTASNANSSGLCYNCGRIEDNYDTY